MSVDIPNDYQERPSLEEILDDMQARQASQDELSGKSDQTEAKKQAAVDKQELRRQEMLLNNATHIARLALQGESGFSADYFILPANRPKTPGDWRHIQESLADDGIRVEYDRVVDTEYDIALSDDYSHKTVNVLSVPDEYSAKHSKKYTGKHRS